jgi:hypothetical protein
MILPGLISIAFYRKRPGLGGIALGLALTVGLSAGLGYISPGGPLGAEGSVLVAILGGVLLYFAVLAYLYLVYYPKHPTRSSGASPARDP